MYLTRLVTPEHVNDPSYSVSGGGRSAAIGGGEDESISAPLMEFLLLREVSAKLNERLGSSSSESWATDTQSVSADLEGHDS